MIRRTKNMLDRRKRIGIEVEVEVGADLQAGKKEDTRVEVDREANQPTMSPAAVEDLGITHGMNQEIIHRNVITIHRLVV